MNFSKDKELVENWLINLIKIFRNEYEKLDELEKSKVSNTSDYRKPCQIEIFWLREPLEFQLVVITHDSERNDMEININGPFKGYEFLDEVEKIMLESRWTKEAPKDSPYAAVLRGTAKYSDLFAGTLNYFLNQIRSSVFGNIKRGYQGGMILVPKSWTWIVAGNIGELDYSKVVEEIIKNTKLEARDVREKPQSESANLQTDNKVKGYGTFFYPPIWVGKIPEKSFKQKVLGVNFTFPSKAFDLTINSKRIVVNSDGFLGVETDTKQDALRILNTIFGIAFLSGYDCLAARDSEIAEISIDPNLLTISSTAFQISSLRTLHAAWFKHEISPFERNEIPEEKIKELIRKAERIGQHVDLTEQIIFLLEGFTHFENSEYSQSFIMSWLIVEKYLFKLWLEFLSERGITGKRKDKFTSSILWSTDHVLETLDLVGKVNKSDYVLLMDLKNKRNNFVHRGVQIDKRTSEKLLDQCLSIVKNDLARIIDCL